MGELLCAGMHIILAASMKNQRDDLASIGVALEQLSREVVSLRRNVRALIKVVQRLEEGHSRLLAEIRSQRL